MFSESERIFIGHRQLAGQESELRVHLQESERSKEKLEKELAEQKVNTSLWRDKCHEILDAVEIANRLQNSNQSSFQALQRRDNHIEREPRVQRSMICNSSPSNSSSLHYSSSENGAIYPETDDYSDRFISSASSTPMIYHTPRRVDPEALQCKKIQPDKDDLQLNFSFESPGSLPLREGPTSIARDCGDCVAPNFRDRPPTSRSLFKESQPNEICRSRSSASDSHTPKRFPPKSQISPRKTVPAPIPHTSKTLETTPKPPKGENRKVDSSPPAGDRKWNPYFGHSRRVSSPKSPSAYDLVMDARHQQQKPNPLKPISPIFHRNSRRTAALTSPNRNSLDSNSELPIVPRYRDENKFEQGKPRSPPPQPFGGLTTTAADGEETLFSWNLTEEMIEVS